MPGKEEVVGDEVGIGRRFTVKSSLTGNAHESSADSRTHAHEMDKSLGTGDT